MRFRVLTSALAVALLTIATACSSATDAGTTAFQTTTPLPSVSQPSATALPGDSSPSEGTENSETKSSAATTEVATTGAATTETVSEAPTTIVTTPVGPTLIAPPATTPEPAPIAGACPYLSTAEVSEANGQRIARTSTIATKPYPICVFYRPDGTVMAVTRIVVANSPAAAAAAVNQHVPIDLSFPVTHPTGWSGGAMSTPKGLPGYPDAGSIYAVSKGSIAVMAISNQKQSIKGRQMVTEVVTNLGL